MLPGLKTLFPGLPRRCTFHEQELPEPHAMHLAVCTVSPQSEYAAYSKTPCQWSYCALKWLGSVPTACLILHCHCHLSILLLFCPCHKPTGTFLSSSIRSSFDCTSSAQSVQSLFGMRQPQQKRAPPFASWHRHIKDLHQAHDTNTEMVDTCAGQRGCCSCL